MWVNYREAVLIVSRAKTTTTRKERTLEIKKYNFASETLIAENNP